MEAGLRLGLGKAEQDTFYVTAENVTRKRLETEVQADEDYERTLKREVNVHPDQYHLPDYVAVGSDVHPAAGHCLCIVAAFALLC